MTDNLPGRPSAGAGGRSVQIYLPKRSVDVLTMLIERLPTEDGRVPSVSGVLQRGMDALVERHHLERYLPTT